MVSSGIKYFSQKILPFILALSMVIIPVSCAEPAAPPPKEPPPVVEEPPPVVKELPPVLEEPPPTVSEVTDYAEDLDLPSEVVQMLYPLNSNGMDANAKAIIDEVYTLPKSLQIHEETLDYVKEIAQDKKISSEEIARFKKLDHDADGLDLEKEEELGADPSKPNPNIKYALDKGLSDYIEQIKLMDEDGNQDENEKSTLDFAYKVSQLGISQEAKEKNIIYILSSLSGKAADFEKVYNQLLTVSEEALNEMLKFRLDDSVIKYLTTVPSLTDKEFAKYALENKLCIQDRKLTDLEINFLKNPDMYSKELFDYNLSEINKINPELAIELGKLPDFKEIEITDIEALEDVLDLTSDNGSKSAFDSMLKEGIPDKRQYCSPLEALLWIANDRDFSEFYRLRYVSLEILINDAWENTTTSNNYQSDRWKNFDEVVDRLNSPNLVSMYMADNFYYKFHSGVIPYDAQAMFNKKVGDCKDYAMFACYCLLNNGFDYNHFEVKDKAACKLSMWRGEHEGHSVCLYKWDNEFYIINLDRVQGPFSTVDEAANRTWPNWVIYKFMDINKKFTKIVRR